MSFTKRNETKLTNDKCMRHIYYSTSVTQTSLVNVLLGSFEGKLWKKKKKKMNLIQIHDSVKFHNLMELIKTPRTTHSICNNQKPKVVEFLFQSVTYIPYFPSASFMTSLMRVATYLVASKVQSKSGTNHG
jgi:hypothetical protein